MYLQSGLFLITIQMLRRQLKYFISIVLIINLTVHEYTSYSQSNVTGYFQTTQVARNRRLSDLKVYDISKDHFLQISILVSIASFKSLLYHFKTHIQTTLKRRTSVVLRIKNVISIYFYLYKFKLAQTNSIQVYI